ncbi:6-phosphogluconolactonase,glucosamine-6-phosphatedeaminase,6-phosphogluconolactonase,Glucosamine-6-phosphateisomerases/6-phosphogluconolactonase [Chlamydia poikilotherma]|uniref:6-phosphogluconolactonase n=1 Tax=Chlamydia poikilotherma TaxID=1967783 RepID=A0A3B0PSQ8_9CHLA|nr:6-phosphogluconolactonase [Chlamydia poikilotherma]SYX09021.1 6-phosphogluconolactonase,glucosamine-6-phosphatedeaminase,6-phosphogluconolactonase,Glucosamine-6-phosphateisomerases/6-phosphogluconolactonase [Chlamydia poikilotherma]
MATLVNFNDTNKLLLIKKPELFIDLASKDWIASANKSIKQRGAFYVALSGGRTPLEIFKEIVKNKEKISDPTKIFLFWGDERSVPHTSYESNYGEAMSILRDLYIPEEQIFRMETEDPDGARKYQDLIESIIPEASFDMIMLGLGEDGHTLSLFPNTQALKEHERLVVFNKVPQLETERMTLTLPVVDKAKHIVVYVQGENKKTIVSSIFFPKDKQSQPYPIELIGQAKTPLFWILSVDAYDSKDFDSISSLYKLDVI